MSIYGTHKRQGSNACPVSAVRPITRDPDKNPVPVIWQVSRLAYHHVPSAFPRLCLSDSGPSAGRMNPLLAYGDEGIAARKLVLELQQETAGLASGAGTAGSDLCLLQQGAQL